MSSQLLENKALSRGIIGKSAPIRAEITIRKSQFYALVAAKIPEQAIREALSEVRVDGARSPAKLFTYKIQRYALAKQKR
jgi:hypothetical protein